MGDLMDCIKPQDTKRFDFDILPDWMFDGEADTVRGKLSDILEQQLGRLVGIKGLLRPIMTKCLGCIEGNHEFQIRKRYNEDIHKSICTKLKCKDLTDEALSRLRFKRDKAIVTVIVYTQHGHGGGRTAGSEPIHLARLRDEWEVADICVRSHSHTFGIIPPKPVLGIPRTGELPHECTQRYRFAANCGCWLYSHPRGKSTYASRANYPARPMLTFKSVIKPFRRVFMNKKEYNIPHIELRQITL